MNMAIEDEDEEPVSYDCYTFQMWVKINPRFQPGKLNFPHKFSYLDDENVTIFAAVKIVNNSLCKKL